MTTIVKQKITFEEFLDYNDDTDYLYELEDGDLIQMAAESDTNQRIASFIFAYLLQCGIKSYKVRIGTEVALIKKSINIRVPDLIVLSEELATEMKGKKRSLITLDMRPPDLVVEIVSPNQGERDYQIKRSEYCARGIPEYWIVDPVLQKITVLQLKEGLYDERVYREEQPIVSLLLGQLDLTAAELLRGGEE